MKKGDVVTVRDSSYSKIITKYGLESSYDPPRDIRGKQCVIIELDCRFPDAHRYQTRDHMCNDTVIRVIETDEVVFIEERFLEPATHKIMIDVKQNDCVMFGTICEISDKLYKEIKNESQTKYTHT